jgi:hypothetical protein
MVNYILLEVVKRDGHRFGCAAVTAGNRCLAS